MAALNATHSQSSSSNVHAEALPPEPETSTGLNNRTTEAALAAIPASAAASAPKDIDDDYKESHNASKSPFPFYVKTLPPLDEHEDEWLEKTGLLKADCTAIDKWVESQMPAWEDLALDKVLRHTKEETGLPRTVHVFKAFSRLCVQVLCKTKKRISPVGGGLFKKGKIAVEWRTKTLWVQYIGKKENLYQQVEDGLEIHDRLSNQPGIFPPACGRSFYKRNSDANKFSFFGPLRDGDCMEIGRYKEQNYSIAWQLLKALDSLEKANIVHYDLGRSNILFYIGSDQRVYVEISDFDMAFIVDFNLAERRENQTCPKNSHFRFDVSNVLDLTNLLDLDPPFLLSMSQRSARQCLADFETQFAEYLS